MRWFLVLLVGCHTARPIAPANVAVPEEVGVTIDPDTEELRNKHGYWKKWSRAYMSQVPGPVCVCEQQPSWIIDTPAGPKTTYMTVCSTYR